VDDSYYGQFGLNANNLVNCDDSGMCEKWEDHHSGCYRGCSVSAFFRPTENSIMNIYWNEGGQEFGPVNEKEIQRLLEVYP